MKTFIFLFILGVLFATPALAQKKVAVVKLLRGEVNILTLGKTAKLAADEWVEEGAVIKTAEKSFVKLVFIDKSQMNVGPNSEMKIENFSGKDSGVIDLVKGKIRSQVSKDYLQIEDKDKSKLFIKTKNAVMGVRGTDFMISTNGVNSSVVLFEGEVVFNRLNSQAVRNSRELEHIVDRGVRMFPGEFSVVEHQRPQPTVPALLNVQQREKLEKNDNFDSSREPSNSDAKSAEAKSVVPAGLNGAVVSNSSETLKVEVAQVAPQPTKENAVAASAKLDGFVQGNKVKPANGSFLHVDTGLIIPPAPDSIADKNSNTYIAGSGKNGAVGENGNWVPPKGVSVDQNGNLFQEVGGEGKLVQIAKPDIFKPDLLGPKLASGFLPHTPNPNFQHVYFPGQNHINNDIKIQNQFENRPSTTNTTIRVETGEQ